MVSKLYVSGKSFFEDSFLLGKKVIESGYQPNYLIALWRGGCVPGMVIQEMLEYHQVNHEHIAVKTKSYTHDKASLDVKIEGLPNISHERILIVDDVYDRGLTLKAVIERLPPTSEVRVATVYFKPKKNMTDRVPDYFIHKTDRWIVFPHELVGLTPAEIKKKGMKI